MSTGRKRTPVSAGARAKAALAPVKVPCIALLTDFGTEGWFVASMKGVILTIAPGVPIVDVTHGVPPHSVVEGALVLQACYRHFPPGTVFVVVIDPGVGTTRDPIVLHAAERYFLAPNNGVLGPVAEETGSRECRVLEDTRYFEPNPSVTFHGRDIFAPAAAHLAAGVPLAQLAPRRTTCFGLPMSAAAYEPGLVEGNIVIFDHFGNAVTNIAREPFERVVLGARKGKGKSRPAEPHLTVSVGNYVLPGLGRTYADVAPGEALAYWGSLGRLEIAVNHGNARELMELRLLDKVIVKRLGGRAA